jgi:hypothetical protein
MGRVLEEALVKLRGDTQQGGGLRGKRYCRAVESSEGKEYPKNRLP